MIKLIATVSSIEQARQLLEAGVDILYFGEDQFGLRLPHSFSREDQVSLIHLAHEFGKEVSIAVNAIFHNDTVDMVPEYLQFLKDQHVDTITVGDPGVIQKIRTQDLMIPYRYDAQVVVTNSRQINFWAKRGAVGAVLAREIPKEELEEIGRQLSIPAEVLVYGATCIHQSRRPLLQNYFNYIAKKESVGKDRGLFLSEPMKRDTHYSIYEDINGTHIFANNDLCLAYELSDLYHMGFTEWKLDGLFTPEDNFVSIARSFNRARQLVMDDSWTSEDAMGLFQRICDLHPNHRGLDTGFYHKDREEVI